MHLYEHSVSSAGSECLVVAKQREREYGEAGAHILIDLLHLFVKEDNNRNGLLERLWLLAIPVEFLSLLDHFNGDRSGCAVDIFLENDGELDLLCRCFLLVSVVHETLGLVVFSNIHANARVIEVLDVFNYRHEEDTIVFLYAAKLISQLLRPVLVIFVSPRARALGLAPWVAEFDEALWVSLGIYNLVGADHSVGVTGDNA